MKKGKTHMVRIKGKNHMKKGKTLKRKTLKQITKPQMTQQQMKVLNV